MAKNMIISAGAKYSIVACPVVFDADVRMYVCGFRLMVNIGITDIVTVLKLGRAFVLMTDIVATGEVSCYNYIVHYLPHTTQLYGKPYKNTGSTVY